MAEFIKYAQRVQKSQEEKDAQELQYQVEDAEDQLSADIKATSREVTKAERVLEGLYGSMPFDSQAILAQEDNVESLKVGLKRLESLKKRLF